MRNRRINDLCIAFVILAGALSAGCANLAGPTTAPAGTAASASASNTATANGSAQASANASTLPSKAFNWNELTVRSSDVSDTRAMFRSPTATLDELEMHATTLKPGQRPHAPHQHPYEEMVVMREGTLEATVNGKVIPLSAGSVLFIAPNDLHGWQNTGTVPATYFIITWKTPRSVAK